MLPTNGDGGADDLAARAAAEDEIWNNRYKAFVTTAREGVWDSFLNDLKRRMADFVADRRTEGTTDYRDFGRRLLAVEQEVLGGADQEKINYLQQYLVACQLEPDTTWKDLFLRYLRSCSGCHMIVLHQFYYSQGKLSTPDRFTRQPSGDVPLTVGKLIGRLPATFQPTLLAAVLADLAAFGLVKAWNTYDSHPGGEWGEARAEEGWSITDNGIRLVSFVLSGNRRDA